MYKKIILIFILTVLPGCAFVTPTSNPSPTNTLTVVELDAHTFKPRLLYSKNPQFISDWARSSTGKFLFINGAYFNEDNTLPGFLVINKTLVGKNTFDQNRSGLITITDGKLTIRDLSSNPIKKNEVFEYALQSYPFLIKEGKPAVATDSGKKARRTAIGTDAVGKYYVIIDNSNDVSLYEFMKKLQKLPITFTNVLNLDGGPSTGLYDNTSSTPTLIDSLYGVPSVIEFYTQ